MALRPGVGANKPIKGAEPRSPQPRSPLKGAADPTSPKSPERGGWKRQGAGGARSRPAPVETVKVRAYRFSLCEAGDHSPETPQLRSPPVAGARRGSKLMYEDTSPGQQKNQASQTKEDKKANRMPYSDYVGKLQNLIGQGTMIMNDRMQQLKLKKESQKDFYDSEQNFEALVEVAHGINTANYHMTKWMHALEPRKHPKPTKPEKLSDFTTDEIFAQMQIALTKMEVNSGKLCPLLTKIVDETRVRKRGDDEIAETDPVALTEKRGVEVDKVYDLIPHLENTLASAMALLTSQQSVSMKTAAVSLMAAMKWKRKALKKKKEGEGTATGSGAAAAFATKVAPEGADKSDKPPEKEEKKDGK